MTGVVSWADAMSAIGFAVMVLGALWGIWWKIDAAIKAAKTESADSARAALLRADFVAAQLSEYKTYVAENYASRVVLREALEPLVKTIEGVSGQVQHMSERLDRVFEGQPKVARSRQT